MLKRVLKWFLGLVEAIIIAYVILITSCILCRNKYNYTEFFEKYTLVTVNDSNQKLISNHDIGDLLIIKNQRFNIDKGDLIYYYASIDDEYVVRSGVVNSKTEDDTSALYVLKDDDNTSVSSNRVIGKYVSIHPGKGTILEILMSRLGFLFLVLLPILLIFIYQIYQLVLTVKYEAVVDDEEETPKKKIVVEVKNAGDNSSNNPDDDIDVL